MELRQLEYFVAVAEEANFTRAAERVRISQSGVSAQIRQLERELGAELFDRSTRTARLTVAGHAVLEHARATLASADAIAQAAGEVTGLIRGRLTVGMVVGCTVVPLFNALAAFHAAYPGVELSLVEDGSDRLIDGVRGGAIDAALIGVAGSTPSGLGSLTIISEGLAALVPREHPLAGKNSVSLGELAGHRIVCMPAGTGIRTVLDRACAATGVRPTIALEASAADAIADLAGRGIGIGVLSASMANRYRDRVSVLGIDGIDIPALLALIWSATRSRALDELVRHAHDAFGAGSPT
jgi:DNA-binding transcriptional LysR family regulator